MYYHIFNPERSVFTKVAGYFSVEDYGNFQSCYEEDLKIIPMLDTTIAYLIKIFQVKYIDSD